MIYTDGEGILLKSELMDLILLSYFEMRTLPLRLWALTQTKTSPWKVSLFLTVPHLITKFFNLASNVLF